MDLKEAYYSIQIGEIFPLLLEGTKIQIYFFDHWVELLSLVLPKILKSIYAMLCRKGHISTAYIDDSCFQWHTKQQCTQNVSDAVHLLENFGFTVHGKKFGGKQCFLRETHLRSIIVTVVTNK